MAAPTLVIGVGGTGVRVLLRVKERFLEAYDQLPDNVILFELDTDNYREKKVNFNGVTLDCDDMLDPLHAEFFHVATEGSKQTLDVIFTKPGDEWKWVNKERMNRTLTKPSDRTIHAGAGTVRPVGRAALFLDYDRVYHSIEQRLARTLTARERVFGHIGDNNEVPEEQKATVFVVASAAGGSGAGMTIDILRMIEHMRNQGALVRKAISVIVLLVGGGAFTNEKGERTESNTFALLRELDRLTAVPGRPLSRDVPPVMFAPEPVKRFSSSFAPADMIFLFDRPDRLDQTRRINPNITNAYLEQVVSPTLADLIMAFADERIAHEIRTNVKDWDSKWHSKDPFKLDSKRVPLPGHYPYVSAGVHTLIFPERDIRRSAGLRFLAELWDEYFVAPELAGSSALAPVTKTLWGQDKDDKPVSPNVFVDVGFARSPICQGAANNQFINMVVGSAKLEKLQLQGRGSIIERTLKVVGLPSGDKMDPSRVAGKLEESMDRDIEQLDRCANVRQVQAWREHYLGSGPLGNELNGEWDERCEVAADFQGHKSEFQDVITKVVQVILNDTDAEKCTLPHRLLYAEHVLSRLERHVLRITQANPDRPESGSLLSECFSKQTNNEAKARDSVQRLEAQASDKLASYIRANQAYARARKDLMAMRLLESMSKALLAAVQVIKEELVRWQKHLRLSRGLIGEAQMKHERNRIEKSEIPVRTYLCQRPDESSYFFQDEFEKKLYGDHQAAAKKSFRESIEWSWVDGKLSLKAPFGKNPPVNLNPEATMARAITWACTKQGNLDRDDAKPPFQGLASPDEVKMSVRIRDFYGGHAPTVAGKLSQYSYLAALCPLKDWPNDRLQYALGLPQTARHEDDVDSFFQEVMTSINLHISQAYRHRPILTNNPENPRHAVGVEFAVGFKLSHRKDYDSYERTYRTDTDRWFALHCLPEEDVASTKFELEFKRKSELYRDLRLLPFVLDPAVVDILGNRQRLELFVNSLVMGIIAQLPAEKRSIEGMDYFVWPNASGADRIRLSRMSTPSEIDLIAAELVDLASERIKITKVPVVMNRLRLMYALRSFVLLEHDVDSAQHTIDYGEVAEEIEKERNTKTVDQRVTGYGTWEERFLDFYRDEHGKHTVLAHLGLVLARVANDLKLTDMGIVIDEDV